MFNPVYVEGLAELEVALRELPDATARNVLRRVAKKVLEPIADRARVLAPYDVGRLIHSIVVGDKLSRRQKSQFQREDPNDVVMFVGAGAVPQAHMMEFGTVDVPPHPFLRPAWDGGKEQVLDSIKGELWMAIDKAAKRAERKAAKLAAMG
jgi:HK97 gp10 family phage protein